MNLDDLRGEWAELHGKLDSFIQLNRAVMRDLVGERVRSSLRRDLGFGLPSLILDALMVIGLGSFLADHHRQLRFFLPAAGLELFFVAILAMGIRQSLRVAQLDLSKSVVASQRQIEQLRRERILQTRWIVLLAPLLWPPLLIVGMKFLGADAWAILGWRYLLANFAVGLAMLPILGWIARRVSPTRPWVKRLLDDIGGRNLARAAEFLESLSKFESA